MTEQLGMWEPTMEERREYVVEGLAAVKRRLDRARAEEVAGLSEAKDLVNEGWALGLGQTEMADLAGVHRQTARRWLGLDTHLNREEERRAERATVRALLREGGGE